MRQGLARLGGVEQQLREARGQVQHGDPLLAQPGAQELRRPQLQRDPQAGAQGDGREDVAQQGIVRQPREHGEAVGGAEPEGGRVPAHEVRQGPVEPDDPLGPPGAPRREGHVGDVVRADLRKRRPRALAPRKRRLPLRRRGRELEAEAAASGAESGLDAVAGRPGRLQGQEGPGPQRLDLGRQPQRRVRRVEQREGGPRAERAEQAGEQRRAAVRVDGDHVAAPDAGLDERVGQAGGGPLQRAVSPGAEVIGDRHGFRSPCGLPGEEDVDGRVEGRRQGELRIGSPPLPRCEHAVETSMGAGSTLPDEAPMGHLPDRSSHGARTCRHMVPGRVAARDPDKSSQLAS